jgi:FHA domain
MADKDDAEKAGGAAKLLGSLRDALSAASREEDSRITVAGAQVAAASTEQASNEGAPDMSSKPENADEGQPPPLPTAAEAARDARGGTPNIPPVEKTAKSADAAPPTTRVVRNSPPAADAEARTKLVRGRQAVERGEFKQDPVVGWLVVVGGPGIGSYRPIFEGNNTVGRASNNRIPIDFGDDAISGEEQAYVRYDSTDRSFLLVPNMSKTNVVSVNEKRPTSATPLRAMDVIAMGRTQLVFVPFCGPEFDWGELSGMKT